VSTSLTCVFRAEFVGCSMDACGEPSTSQALCMLQMNAEFVYPVCCLAENVTSCNLND
jgi:hypothetical protein